MRELKTPNLLGVLAMRSISIDTLEGYDKELETLRQVEFDKFLSADTRDSKRRAFRAFAGLTLQRNPVFTSAIDRARGIEVAK